MALHPLLRPEDRHELHENSVQLRHPLRKVLHASFEIMSELDLLRALSQMVLLVPVQARGSEIEPSSDPAQGLIRQQSSIDLFAIRVLTGGPALGAASKSF